MKQLLYILSLTIILNGCNQTVQQTDDAHAHDAKIQLTEYSNIMELFAEADPLAVGQNSEILAHFTWLENFKPLESGDVTISLIVGTKGVKQTLSQPVRPGIYKFTLQPQVAGVGRLIFNINSENGETEIIVNNITVYDNKHDAEHAAEEIVVSETNATFFTKEQSWKVDFATGFPLTEPFGQVIKTTALVQSSQGSEIVVSAKTNGIVLFNSGEVLEGKDVSAGQSLFTISAGNFADNNISVKYAEAKSNYEKANADYERAKELAKDKIVSEKDLLSAKNQYENTKAIFDNLNKNFNASGQTITSPQSGFIKQVFVKNGTYVEAGQPVVVISQNKSLILSAEVNSKFAPVLANIKTANIRNIINNSSFSLEQLNGKVLSYGKAVNSDNFLIPVILQVENNGSFVSGNFVEVYLKTFTNNTAVTVPNEALLEEQGSFFVWVQVHPELFEKREVTIGGNDGLKTEIRKGISPTERIVTRGAMLIKLAQATGGLDAHSGHNH
ncbi:MAG: efflux RND transporter periplasmic adaptor subunit [Desulfobulbaceae bacterium]|nr:efflux RND transporter periplasmic adaptor subunit [Desulfobulbaceae bacterium]